MRVIKKRKPIINKIGDQDFNIKKGSSNIGLNENNFDFQKSPAVAIANVMNPSLNFATVSPFSKFFYQISLAGTTATVGSRTFRADMKQDIILTNDELGFTVNFKNVVFLGNDNLLVGKEGRIGISNLQSPAFGQPKFIGFALLRNAMGLPILKPLALLYDGNGYQSDFFNGLEIDILPNIPLDIQINYYPSGTVAVNNTVINQTGKGGWFTLTVNGQQISNQFIKSLGFRPYIDFSIVGNNQTRLDVCIESINYYTTRIPSFISYGSGSGFAIGESYL